MCYSLKQCCNELSGVNSTLNKFNRKEYVEKMHGTHWKRLCHRIRRWDEFHSTFTASAVKGVLNLHCVGAISPFSLILFENRRRSLRSEDLGIYCISGISWTVFSRRDSDCHHHRQLSGSLQDRGVVGGETSRHRLRIFDDILFFVSHPTATL